MSTHNLCIEKQYEKYQNFLSEKLLNLVVKFSIYLNWHCFCNALLLYKSPFPIFHESILFAKVGVVVNSRIRVMLRSSSLSDLLR